MKIIFGKGRVGNGLSNLLTKLNIEHIMMDDADYNADILSSAEQVIVSPGVPPHHDLYKKFWDKTISELNFLWWVIKELWLDKKIEFIWITGTNGKSTTTHIIYSIFTWLDLPRKVWLSGNFKIPLGQTLYEILDQNLQDQEHLIIVETSSFMLYNISNFDFDYGVLTNVSTDHLNWHPDFEDYINTKFNVFRQTKIKGFVAEDLFDKLPADLQFKVEVYNSIYDLTNTKFVWIHNQANLGVATQLVAKYLTDHDLEEKIYNIPQVLTTIKPLEHRMDPVKELNGITIYDDGKSTSSHSLSAALTSFDDPIVAICGGFDKGDSFDHMADIFAKHIWYWILMWTTAPQFAKIFDSKNIPYTIYDNIHDVVANAYNKAQELWIKIVLFSPGCASFDMFDNVDDRAAKFLKELELLW